MHILTSQLSDDVSAVVPMVDDLEEYSDLFTARDMLTRLQKYFGLGDHIQANAACKALCNFTVDMRNIPKYVQKWRSTILALHAEHYPIGYIDTVLNFMRNLPVKDHGWFMSRWQEVTQECGQNPNSIDYNYLIGIVNHIVDLDTQWRMSKLSKCSLHPKCDVCGLQSHMTQQHDPSKQHNPDSSSVNRTTAQQFTRSIPCPPDRSSLP